MSKPQPSAPGLPKLSSSGLPKPPRVHFGFNWRRGGLALLFLLATAVSGYGGAWLQDRLAGEDDISVQRRIVTSESRLINQIAEAAGPSVVSVNVAVATGRDGGPFGLGQSLAEGAGTGIIISSSGYVMTNRHVVPEGTEKVSVTLSDGTELADVSIVGRASQDDSLDVAFLKINEAEGRKLTAAKVGDSSKVEVGDNVVAIGNALGQFQNTVTAGIISGYGRSVLAAGSRGYENLDDLFQTDAAINEGNSGGPLVNINGEVIGMNTAVAGDGAENIGFAIPVNDVRGLIDQVIKTGKFARPYLGVRYVPLTADVAKQYELEVENGAFIIPSADASNPSVLTGGPAAKAGLKEGDIILAVNDKKVDQRHSLTSLLGVYQPGARVKLEVRRGNESRHFKVELGSLPADR